MFRRKKDEAQAQEEFRAPEEAAPAAEAKKGRPTPSRKEAEAANKRPLVPSDRSQAGKQDKQQRRLEREQAQRAMETGDERHMPAQHAGKERRYIRDYVDARFSLGEFFLPVALIGMVFVLLVGRNPALSTIVLLVIYAGFAIVIGDAVLAVRRMKKKMIAKWGPAGYPRGAAMYAIARMFQIRRVRQPKPMVKRGEFPK